MRHRGVAVSVSNTEVFRCSVCADTGHWCSLPRCAPVSVHTDMLTSCCPPAGPTAPPFMAGFGLVGRALLPARTSAQLRVWTQPSALGAPHTCRAGGCSSGTSQPKAQPILAGSCDETGPVGRRTAATIRLQSEHRP